jgi:two-component system, response regulator / RNA-binding antiterminator
MGSSLRILLIDEAPERASALEVALEAAGHTVVARLATAVDLTAQIAASGAEVIIVDMNSPDRDTIESLREVTRERPRPILMFVDRSDESMITEAINAGVSAYVVDGLNPARVKPVLDVAIARFNQFQVLNDEIAKAKASLAERKVIERAKGILMRERKLSEEDAYRVLRSAAMEQNKRLADIAESLISAAKMLR